MSGESIVWGSLIGDALALGPHWVYDPKEIAVKIRMPDQFHDPISPYHPGKKAGDFTHYGDQVMVLLRHMAGKGGFDLSGYADEWRGYWEDASTISYRDGATKETLANLNQGKSPQETGAHSHDIAGVSIIAPLFLLKWADDASLLAACREVVAFTHNEPDVLGATEFFAKVVLAAGWGEKIRDAVGSMGAQLPPGNLKDWLAAGEESAASSAGDGEALESHGLSCNVDGGFAGVVHLLMRYPKDPFTALVANVTAGGDSAARGMILGMVYGAAGLIEDLPQEWRDNLTAREEIETLLKAVHGK